MLSKIFNSPLNSNSNGAVIVDEDIEKRDDSIEILSDDVEEIIGHTPNWILRSGISIVTGILVLFIAISWFVRYPDIIIAPMKLNAFNAPKLLTNTVEGKLAKLLVKDQELVRNGQALAWLQTPVSYMQAIGLKNWIDSLVIKINDNGQEELKNLPIPNVNQLGELQFTFQEFSKVYYETLDILSNGYYQRKKKSILNDMQQIRSMYNSIKSREDILKEDYEVALSDYSINEKLYSEKVVSTADFNAEKSKRLSKEAILSDIQSQYINNSTLLNTKQQELHDVDKVINDQWHNFQAALSSLSSQLDKWMKTYILVAPEDGKVQFVGLLEENQWIKINQDLFYIMPFNTSYYGEALVSQYRLGKLKIGQTVVIKFESFPQEEFGTVSGLISYISNIPDKDGNFLVKIAMKNGLVTNLGKQIYFRSQLVAKAEIITSRERLFMKLVNKISALLER